MALTEKQYLYRVRVLLAADGSVELVETVHRTQIARDGKVISDQDSATRSYPADSMSPAVKTLLAAIERVGKEEDAKRLKAEAEKAKETAG